MKTLSIIIAVYNAESFIERLLQSIPDTEDIEIIVIDDGSSDNTYDVVKRIASQDHRVHLCHQNNMGVSMARNNGLSIATGEWVFFVDADDWLNPKELTFLLHKIKCTSANIITFGSHHIYNEMKEEHIVVDKIYSNIEFINSSHFQLASWSYLFRRSLLLKNNISFPGNVICSEDQNFNLKALCCTNMIESINICVYNYNRLNSSSASHISPSVKWVESRLLSINDLLLFVKNMGIDTSILLSQTRRFYDAFLCDDCINVNNDVKYNIYRREYLQTKKLLPMFGESIRFRLFSYNKIVFGFLIRPYCFLKRMRK